MSKAARNTLALVLLALALVFIDFYAHVRPQAEPDQLPGIAAVKASEVDELTLTRGDQRLVLEKQEGLWMLTAPIEYRANEQAVHTLLASLKEGIPFDVRVEEGNLDRYGLDASNCIFVQIDAAGSLTAFYVGNNAAGGSTYVRFPSSQTVYRARIGGRSRYERQPADWRDKRVHPFDPQEVTDLVIERHGQGDLEFNRGESGWSSAMDSLDTARLQSLLQILSDLTAHELLSADHPKGEDQATLAIATSREDSVLVFSRLGDEFFARNTDEPMIFRVGPQVLEQLLVPDWRDPALLGIDPKQIVELQLIEPGLISLLKKDG
ncbi:MAG: DUF4340 domain-containing protein, partial [Proteobacteria bacterium]|nr:DUF4340 domain-containing protein [Pseudomonadota bacterium]